MRFRPEQDEALQGLSRQVQDQLNRLVAEVQQDRPVSKLLGAMMTELGVTLEELTVAEEEMRVQNDALGEAGKSLEAERQRYRDLFEFAPDPYLLTDLSGVVLEANQAAFVLLGLGPRSLIGKPLVIYVAPEDRLAFHTALSAAKKAGTGKEAAERQEQELTLHPRKRRAVNVLARTGLVRSAQGQPSAMRWLLRDNTARKLADLERYRQIIEGVHDYAIFTMDLAGTVTGWNAGAQRLLGYSAAEIIGQPAAVIFTPEDRAAGLPASEISQAAAVGRAPDDRWHLRKDGSRFWGSGSMMALYDDHGTALSLAKVVRDSTALHSEQQREHAIATQLQATLLPNLPSAMPGLGLAYFYQPAWEEASVGGDFADVSRPESGCTALVVGDMAGKGLEAAAQTAVVRNMLRYALYRGRTLNGAVSCLNSLVIEQELLSGFATLFVGTFDEREKTLTYVNCGQEPALVWRADTGVVEELPYTGPLLGIKPDAEYEQREVSLNAGDIVAVFTDGLTDIGEDRRTMLGVGGVTALLQKHGAAVAARAGFPLEETASELVERLMAEALGWGLVRDDVCLLLAVVAG